MLSKNPDTKKIIETSNEMIAIQQFPLLDLPFDLLLQVFSFLPINNIKNIALTSKRTNEVINANEFWRLKYIKHFPNWYEETAKEKNINWYKAFKKANARAYKHKNGTFFSHGIISVFSHVKEGDLAWLKENKNNVELYMETYDCNGFDILDWAQINYARTRDEDYNEICKFIFQLVLNRFKNSLVGLDFIEQVLNTQEKHKMLHYVIRCKKDLNNLNPYDINLYEILQNSHQSILDKTYHFHLHTAAIYGNTDQIQVLLDHRFDINALTSENVTPLFYAVEYKHLDAVKLLLANNAEVLCHLKENRNKRFAGDTPLHVAIKNDDIEILRELLKYLANDNDKLSAALNAVNIFGESPLMLAVRVKNIKMVREILKYRPNLALTLTKTIKNKDRGYFSDFNVFHMVADNDSEEILDLLLAANPPKEIINALTDDQFSSLNLAVLTNNVTFVSKLLNAGANPNIGNVLDSAFSKTHATQDIINTELRIAKLLVAYGAKIDAKNENNETVLHIAADSGCVEYVAFTLDAMKKTLSEKQFINCMNEKNIEGKSAFVLALLNNANNVAITLLQNGASTCLGGFFHSEEIANCTFLYLFDAIDVIRKLPHYPSLQKRELLIQSLNDDVEFIINNFSWDEDKLVELKKRLVVLEYLQKLDEHFSDCIPFLDSEVTYSPTRKKVIELLREQIDNFYSRVDAKFLSEDDLKNISGIKRIIENVKELDAIVAVFDQLLQTNSQSNDVINTARREVINAFRTKTIADIDDFLTADQIKLLSVQCNAFKERIEQIDQLLLKFSHLFATKPDLFQPNRKLAFERLQQCIIAAYQNELSYFELEMELTNFSNIDAIAQQILQLEYQGDSDDFHNYKTSLHQCVNAPYLRYANSKFNRQSLEVISDFVSDVDNHIDEFLSSSNKTSQKTIRFFSRDKFDVEFLQAMGQIKKSLFNTQISKTLSTILALSEKISSSLNDFPGQKMAVTRLQKRLQKIMESYSGCLTPSQHIELREIQVDLKKISKLDSQLRNYQGFLSATPISDLQKTLIAKSHVREVISDVYNNGLTFFDILIEMERYNKIKSLTDKLIKLNDANLLDGLIEDICLIYANSPRQLALINLRKYLEKELPKLGSEKRLAKKSFDQICLSCQSLENEKLRYLLGSFLDWNSYIGKEMHLIISTIMNFEEQVALIDQNVKLHFLSSLSERKKLITCTQNSINKYKNDFQIQDKVSPEERDRAFDLVSKIKDYLIFEIDLFIVKNITKIDALDANNKKSLIGIIEEAYSGFNKNGGWLGQDDTSVIINKIKKLLASCQQSQSMPSSDLTALSMFPPAKAEDKESATENTIRLER